MCLTFISENKIKGLKNKNEENNTMNLQFIPFINKVSSSLPSREQVYTELSEENNIPLEA